MIRPDLSAIEWGDQSKFNDPFLTFAGQHLPKDFYTALDLALFLFYLNPQFQQATARTIAHFITKLSFVGQAGDQREQTKYRDYLIDQLQILDCLQMGGIEQLALGNSFLRIYYPFDRYLIDWRGGSLKMYDINKFERTAKFDISSMRYTIPDPMELARGHIGAASVDLPFTDKASKDPSRIKIQRIDPRRMLLTKNLISGTTEYIYRFEEFFISQVNQAMLHQINETPKSMLEAISQGKYYKFNNDSIFHLKNPTLVSLSQNGWGIPNSILCYRDIRQLQLLKCADESIAMDFILPYRVISPAPTSANGTGQEEINYELFMEAMVHMTDMKRRAPTSVHTAPFPIQLQELGASGKSLMPFDALQFHFNNMLDGAGYPAELFRNSLQVQQVPTAIRMFETAFMHVPRGLNRALTWASTKILNYLERDLMYPILKPPSIVDNMENRHILLNLGAGGEVSRQTYLEPLGIDDPIEEMRTRMWEDITIEETKHKMQADFERSATMGSMDQITAAQLQGQGAPPGAAPVGGDGGQGTTPLEIRDQAIAKAQEIAQLPANESAAALRQLSSGGDETFYWAVKGALDDIRSQARSDGYQALRAQ